MQRRMGVGKKGKPKQKRQLIKSEVIKKSLNPKWAARGLFISIRNKRILMLRDPLSISGWNGRPFRDQGLRLGCTWRP